MQKTSKYTPHTPITEEHGSQSSMREFSQTRDSGTSKLDSLLYAQQNTNILSLTDRFIGEAGAAKLAKYLTEHTHFVSIELRGNNLNPPSFAKICEGLKENTGLKTLHLEWNAIGAGGSDEGLQALLSVMQNAKGITMIDLRNNSISAAAAGTLVEIIRRAEQLQTLDLRWNDITDSGGERILEAIKGIDRKLFIDLSGNRIREDLILQINSLNAKQIQSHRAEDLASNYLSERTQSAQESKTLRAQNYASPIEITEYPSPKQYEIPPTQGSGEKTSHKKADLYSQYQFQSFPQTYRTYGPQTISEMRSPGLSEFKPAIDSAKLIERAYHSLNVPRQEEDKWVREVSEKYKREEVERKLLIANEEIRRKDVLIADLTTRVQVLTQELKNKTSETDKFYETTARTRNEFTDKVRELEVQTEDKVSELVGQLAALRNEIEKISANHVQEIKTLGQEWEAKLQASDQKVAVLTKELETYEQENKILTETLELTRKEIEERVRRADTEAREAEAKRHGTAIRVLEDNLRSSDMQREEFLRKIDLLTSELQGLERRYHEEKNRLELEKNRVKSDYDRARGDLSLSLTEIERLKNELFSKDNALRNLERDYLNHQREMKRLKDAQHEEIDRLKIEMNQERRKLNDDIRYFESLWKESDKRNREVENDASAKSARYNMESLLTDNIQRILGRAFNEIDANQSTTIGKYSTYLSTSGRKEYPYK